MRSLVTAGTIAILLAFSYATSYVSGVGVLEIFAIVLIGVGGFLLSQKVRVSHVHNCMGSAIFAYLLGVSQAYAMMVLSVIFFIGSAYAFVRWGKNGFLDEIDPVKVFMLFPAFYLLCVGFLMVIQGESVWLDAFILSCVAFAVLHVVYSSWVAWVYLNAISLTFCVLSVAGGEWLFFSLAVALFANGCFGLKNWFQAERRERFRAMA